MRKLAILALLLVGLAGCATNAPYGNFAAAPLDLNQKMAAATVAQLVALYPPAQTRFNLKQPTTDAYGASLVDALRAKGYALLEFAPQGAGQGGPQGAASASAPQAASQPVAAAEPGGLDLRYIVDAPAATNLYRVTVLVGQESISRAFVSQNGTVVPAGAWVRKE
ncbi:hypothetical protein R69658_05977 [Paraburkholderia aspalathi]|uniref:Conjugal transfer protein TrbH n=1 Tax=Paraburkholderia aspalathi TaxID=1324617 RepID=A0ABM8SPA3_9BURK|nr:conjugal transfer protein TrbH [Paraburkholderia aspalathi]MBK3822248.1 conjugal transfer protein TrbH [Paraburkholderia aspalathi]MBK3834092.1 conjugal transfer protein TrbH [Paraburkholderia aspalathi]MBK3863788.1 conjugal transfer protein TrbH [Paraburkholderia aspalathi]CAE6823878.1 hypothetical protein R69658_05977 [Paraburkholderia aspalathi]